MNMQSQPAADPAAPPATDAGLLQQALADTPEYITHIRGLFESCAENLRDGDDRQAMMALARAADDLHQFTLLVGLMVDAAEGMELPDTQRFRDALDVCIKGIQEALVADDLISVSDQIDSDLLPLLPTWNQAIAELSASFAQA